jgi:hypothetical protein
MRTRILLPQPPWVTTISFVPSSLLFRRLKSSVHASKVAVSAPRIPLELLLTALAPAPAVVVCKCRYKFYIHVVLQHNYRKKMM